MSHYHWSPFDQMFNKFADRKKAPKCIQKSYKVGYQTSQTHKQRCYQREHHSGPLQWKINKPNGI